VCMCVPVCAHAAVFTKHVVCACARCRWHLVWENPIEGESTRLMCDQKYCMEWRMHHVVCEHQFAVSCGRVTLASYDPYWYLATHLKTDAMKAMHFQRGGIFANPSQIQHGMVLQPDNDDAACRDIEGALKSHVRLPMDVQIPENIIMEIQLPGKANVDNSHQVQDSQLPDHVRLAVRQHNENACSEHPSDDAQASAQDASVDATTDAPSDVPENDDDAQASPQATDVEITTDAPVPMDLRAEAAAAIVFTYNALTQQFQQYALYCCTETTGVSSNETFKCLGEGFARSLDTTAGNAHTNAYKQKKLADVMASMSMGIDFHKTAAANAYQRFTATPCSPGKHFATMHSVMQKLRGALDNVRDTHVELFHNLYKAFQASDLLLKGQHDTMRTVRASESEHVKRGADKHKGGGRTHGVAMHGAGKAKRSHKRPHDCALEGKPGQRKKPNSKGKSQGLEVQREQEQHGERVPAVMGTMDDADADAEDSNEIAEGTGSADRMNNIEDNEDSEDSEDSEDDEPIFKAMWARAEAASRATGKSVQEEFTWLLKQKDNEIQGNLWLLKQRNEIQGNLSHVNFTCGRCKKSVCAGRCLRERTPHTITFRRGPPQGNSTCG
jgi:hypothetical protein